MVVQSAKQESRKKMARVDPAEMEGGHVHTCTLTLLFFSSPETCIARAWFSVLRELRVVPMSTRGIRSSSTSSRIDVAPSKITPLFGRIFKVGCGRIERSQLQFYQASFCFKCLQYQGFHFVAGNKFYFTLLRLGNPRSRGFFESVHHERYSLRMRAV